MKKELTLLIGGARSGKSALAERLAAKADRVLFVATAQAFDEDMERRIANHRSGRPESWHTLEEPIDLVASMRSRLLDYDVVLLDCLTLWVSNILLQNENREDVEQVILAAAIELLALYESGDCSWIIVSNEVGLGIVPSSSLSRAYRDALGRVNQLVAARADRVYLMSAGLALEMKSLGALPVDQID